MKWTRKFNENRDILHISAHHNQSIQKVKVLILETIIQVVPKMVNQFSTNFSNIPKKEKKIFIINFEI